MVEFLEHLANNLPGPFEHIVGAVGGLLVYAAWLLIVAHVSPVAAGICAGLIIAIVFIVITLMAVAA